MRSRFLIVSLFLALLLTGCRAQKRDPVIGAYSPEDGTGGVYLFLEDGTGARTEYPEPHSDQSTQRPFTYALNSGVLTLRFADGTSEAYRYSLSERHLFLTGSAGSLLLTRLGEERPVSASDVWKDYWSLFGITAAALMFIHLTMPYTPRFHPPLDDMPELCFPTFSKGQLIQYLIQVPTLPAIILGCAWLSVCLGMSKELAIALGSGLTGVWGLLPPNLARRIDGW